MHMTPCSWQRTQQTLTGTSSTSCCTHAGLCLAPLEQSFQVHCLLLYNAAISCVLTPCLVASATKMADQRQLPLWPISTQVSLPTEILQYSGASNFLEARWWAVGGAKLEGEDLNYLGVPGFRIAGGQGVAIIAICQARQLLHACFHTRWILKCCLVRTSF